MLRTGRASRVSSPLSRFPAGRRSKPVRRAALEQQQSPASRADAVRRLGRRIAGYYTGVIAPGASRMARARSAGKALAASAAIGFVLLAAYSIVLIPFTPSIGRPAQSQVRPAQRADVGRRQGARRVPAQQPRMGASWSRSRPTSIDALIATEDHRFYEHHGIDFRRTLAAVAAHPDRRPPGRLDHHAAAGAQPVSRRRSAARRRSPARSRKPSPR